MSRKLDHLLQVRITEATRRKLEAARETTGLDSASLTRLALSHGLPRVLRKLTATEPVVEPIVERGV